MENKEPKFEDTEPVWEETTPVTENDTFQASKEDESLFDDPVTALSAAVTNPFQMGPRLDALYETVTGVNEDKSFDEKVAEAKAYRELLEKYNPKSYAAGAIGRELATSAVGLPVKVVQGLGVAAKAAPVVASLLTNVAQGAVTGAGESDTSLTQDPEQFLKDVGTGALTGVVGTGAGEVLQFVGKKAVPFLKESAEKSAVASLGFNKNQLKKLKKQSPDDFEGILKAGRFALDKGITGGWKGSEGRFEKIQELVSENEDILSDALRKMDESGTEMFSKSIDEIKEEALQAYRAKNTIAGKSRTKASDEESFKNALDMLTRYDDPTRMQSKLLASDLQAEKIALNEAGKYAKIEDANTTIPATVDAARALRTQYKKAIEDYAKLTGSLTGEELADIKNVNKDLGMLYDLRTSAEDQVLKQFKGEKSEGAGSIIQAAGLLNLDPKLLAIKPVKQAISDYWDSVAAGGKDLTRKIGEGLAKQSDKLPLQSGFRTAGTGLTKEAIRRKGVVAEVAPETQEETAALSEEARQIQDPKAQQLADVLEKASQAGDQKRKSLMFSLMQDKDYRRLLNELKQKKGQ